MKTLAAELVRRGHKATFALAADTDVILLVDPRVRNPQLTIKPHEIFDHLGFHPETIVVHRINECDERKATKTMNLRLRVANYVADHTVFIASWLSDLDVWRRETPSSVILNGADEHIFVPRSAKRWDGAGPLKLVTHHWGAHGNKGWDVYGKIDRLISDPAWQDRVSLTFIGNKPGGSDHRNIHFLAPLDGQPLAKALAEHHVYVTASINEPAGMHHVEGGLLGMPILYRRSGALPEYCAPFGIGFEGPADFTAALSEMFRNYLSLRQAADNYPNTATRMSAKYIDLFEQLYADRRVISSTRRRWRNPIVAIGMRFIP